MKRKIWGSILLLTLLSLAFGATVVSAQWMGPYTGTEGPFIVPYDTATGNFMIDATALGQVFTIRIAVSNVTGLRAWQVGLAWDPSVLMCTAGPTIPGGSSTPDWAQGNPVASPILTTPDNVAGVLPPCGQGMDPGYTVDWPVGTYGELLELDLQVMDVGLSPLHIGPDPVGANCFLLDVNSLPIPFWTLDGYINMPTPEPTPPGAAFTYSSPDAPYPGTYNFDASASTLGFDGTDPCPITEYWWDWENDGIVDDVLGVPTTSHDFLVPGTYEVNLTVYAPPGPSPDPDYFPYGNTTQSINVFEVPTGPFIDIYVQKTPQGKGFLEHAASFAPGEEVVLIARVTYNGLPVYGELVAFTSFANLSIPFMYGEAVSEYPDGTCNVSFRIPMPPAYGNDLMSAWYAGATVNIGGTTVEDWTGFTVGWLLESVSIETTNEFCEPKSSFVRGDTLGFKIHIKSIGLIQLETCITIVVQDEVGNTLGYFQLGAPSYGVPLFVVEPGTAIGVGVPVMPSDTWLYCFLYIDIPTWAFAGVGTARLNLYTNEPYLFLNPLTGVPYCPEISVAFSITA